MSQPTSHHRRLAVTAGVTAAVAALAALGAVPAAAAAPTNPAAAVAVSQQPRVGNRPVPAQIRAELFAAARRAAAHRQDHLAAGFRPIPGTTVSTDLPSRVAIGSPSTVVAFRTSVPSTAGYTTPYGAVALVLGGRYVVDFLAYLLPGQATFRGNFLLDGNVLPLGTGYWSTTIGDESRGTRPQEATVPVAVKLRTLLGASITRSGPRITVFGANKTYTGGLDFLPLIGQRVDVQRYTSSGWRTFRTLTTDQRGHVTTTASIPYRAAIRAVTLDTAIAFGAATAGTVL